MNSKNICELNETCGQQCINYRYPAIFFSESAIFFWQRTNCINHFRWVDKNWNLDGKLHGLRTPNECINHRYLKNWADVADKTCFSCWEWDWIFSRAVKSISSPGFRSPWAWPLSSLHHLPISKIPPNDIPLGRSVK